MRDEFRQPDVYEFAPYHVGCTHLHEQLDIDEYFAVRTKEDLHSYREWQGYAPRTEQSANVSNIMEVLYRRFTQHKWLPLQTAWPFNLRMVMFVLMHADSSDAIVADKLVQRIRSWGCPVSPFGDGYSEWRQSNGRDVVFNTFSIIASGQRYRSRLVKDLLQIRVAIQDDKWLPRRPRRWNRRESESERNPLGPSARVSTKQNRSCV